MACPCGSGQSLSSCCRPYLEEKKIPPTCEALMRSRYTAYTQNNLDYIEKTMRGDALKQFYQSSSKENPQEIEWLKLDVLFSEEAQTHGTVQFIATFQCDGNKHFLHEMSFFEKINGQWYYTKGMVS